jgi:hypothetical protein
MSEIESTVHNDIYDLDADGERGRMSNMDMAEREGRENVILGPGERIVGRVVLALKN